MSFLGTWAELPLKIQQTLEQQKFQNKLFKAQQQQFQQQMDWQKELRGEGGTPVGLARYTGDYEPKMFGVGSSLMDLTNPDYQKALAQGQGYTTDAANANKNYFQNVTSGARGAQRLSELQPALEARTAGAKTNVQAWNEAKQAQLNAIRSANVAAGYSATGMPAMSRMAGADYAARTAQAKALSDAQLANALATAGVQETNWQEMAQAAQQYPAAAQQLINLQYLPGQLALTDFASRYGMSTTPARINQQYTTIPGYTPISQYTPSPIQAILGAAGSTAGSLLDSYYNKQLENQLQSATNDYNFWNSYDNSGQLWNDMDYYYGTGEYGVPDTGGGGGGGDEGVGSIISSII